MAEGTGTIAAALAAAATSGDRNNVYQLLLSFASPAPSPSEDDTPAGEAQGEEQESESERETGADDKSLRCVLTGDVLALPHTCESGRGVLVDALRLPLLRLGGLADKETQPNTAVDIILREAVAHAFPT